MCTYQVKYNRSKKHQFSFLCIKQTSDLTIPSIKINKTTSKTLLIREYLVPDYFYSDAVCGSLLECFSVTHPQQKLPNFCLRLSRCWSTHWLIDKSASRKLQWDTGFYYWYITMLIVTESTVIGSKNMNCLKKYLTVRVRRKFIKNCYYDITKSLI